MKRTLQKGTMSDSAIFRDRMGLQNNCHSRELQVEPSTTLVLGRLTRHRALGQPVCSVKMFEQCLHSRLMHGPPAASSEESPSYLLDYGLRCPVVFHAEKTLAKDCSCVTCSPAPQLMVNWGHSVHARSLSYVSYRFPQLEAPLPSSLRNVHQHCWIACSRLTERRDTLHLG